MAKQASTSLSQRLTLPERSTEFAEVSKSIDLQQFSIKRTTRNFLKALQSNAFKKFLGSGLSAKRCKTTIDKLHSLY